MSLENGGGKQKAADGNHDHQLKSAGKDSGFEDPRQQADAAAMRLSAESNSGDAARPAKDKVAVNDIVARPNEGGAEKYVVKENPADYASYASAVKGMPKDGIGSVAELHDTFNYYREQAGTNDYLVAYFNKAQQAVLGNQTLQA